MFKIPLRKSNDVKCLQLIDLQGSLETRPEKDKPLNSVTLGSLTFSEKSDQSKDRCSLTIERQKCDGKKIALKKPLLICRKVINAQNNQTEYIIVGVAKEKLQFRSRPTPLTPSPQQQKTKTIDFDEMSSSSPLKLSSQESVARTLFFSPKTKKEEK
ncbi:hypothetical protein FDP41_001664 [Naegleria fowleri]|uniref:Uncharacterized protein n=1 Tax=Naegleria fowleri TaxID=5763 RepID=A0A6A5BXS8_NAEFO|nr:uncharacterized protein FDP41_001664 [Naegleria fowleri]KAF0979321.1 hypothetical protein FDP41_001664 [Naegleria fowleri]CAG4718179.1 unnamed protein product [Naegleria fowleri]